MAIDWADLAKLARLKFLHEAEKNNRLKQAIDHIAQERGLLEQRNADALAVLRDPGQETLQRAQVHWQKWVDRTAVELNMEEANIRAQREGQRPVLAKAFGKMTVAEKYAHGSKL